MTDYNYQRFSNLTFEKFRELARDDALSPTEKVGFPESYRAGKEEKILADIVGKLPNLAKANQRVLDIGPGCSPLAFLIIDFCRRKGHQLVLIDSAEMLDQLPDEPFILKLPGYYPTQTAQLFDQYAGKMNVILTYSVLQYVFVEGNLYDFMDRTLGLLADGGEFLIGDIPNISKRKRFFSSSNGINFHQQFTESGEVPTVQFNQLEPHQIDDAVIVGLMMRCRAAGFDAFVVPQSADLPMANRREDILVRKP